MQRKLRRVGFDTFIMSHFLHFLNTEGNYCERDGMRFLKPGKDFAPIDIPGRSDIVDEKIWQEVIMKHLKFHNYN